jgi:hypothetical protein
MQTANIMLALGGDKGNCVPKYGVTAAEIAVLRAIHGDDAVFDVEPTGEDALAEDGEDALAEDGERKRTNREELARLQHQYASGRLFGTDVRAVGALFPGAAARVFEDIDELSLSEEAFKAESRATAKSKPAKAGKGKKGAKTEEPEEDGVGDMTDGKSAFE